MGSYQFNTNEIYPKSGNYYIGLPYSNYYEPITPIYEDFNSQKYEFVSKVGDSLKFDMAAIRNKGITNDIEFAIVFLESEGGLIKDALEIGARIRTLNYSTIVETGKGCYSACALIWIAGADRYMNDGSLIGVHAAYRINDGVALESGVANGISLESKREYAHPATSIPLAAKPRWAGAMQSAVP